jgi:hypothetical protein
MSDVKQIVMVVLLVVLVRPELDRVNPDPICGLHDNVVTGSVKTLLICRSSGQIVRSKGW